MPNRAELDIHLVDAINASQAMCGDPSPIRAITEEEANDPNGRHFTCPQCLNILQHQDNFGDDE